MGREGVERLLNERRAYLKPKYARQKNDRDAIYGAAKRQRTALVAAMLADPHIAPF